MLMVPLRFFISLKTKSPGKSYAYCSRYLFHCEKIGDDFCGMEGRKNGENQETLLVPSARIEKLIASEPNPLLAKEIFDLASGQPNFHPSYSILQTLILKLGRSRHLSLMESLITVLQSRQYPVSSSLFTRIIEIYGEVGLPDKALKTFYTILEFNIKPRPNQLNRILQILVGHRSFIRSAFDLFRSAHKYGVSPNTQSYNILMRAFCLTGDLSIAYSLFDKMFKRDVLPDVESYRVLIQGLCRKSQVNRAVDLLEDMLNKGFVPDAFCYTTLINSLCRKKKLKEAYKLLCRMKAKGCNPDIVHYNTIISGYCRVDRSTDACKVLDDMASNGCLPNLVSYQTIIVGLCKQGMNDEAKNYFDMMLSKELFPHCSVVHKMIKGYCNSCRVEDACEIVCNLLSNGKCPHIESWAEILPRICDTGNSEELGGIIDNVLKVNVNLDTKIVDAGTGLGEYLIRSIQARARRH